MLFNSLDFAVFFPVVFVLYWLINKQRLIWQNLLVVAASYVFYGWWDWRFLLLIVFSTLVDFSIGRLMETAKSKRRRKWLLWSSLAINLGLLGFFKYFNFFVDNFRLAFTFFGSAIDTASLNIILPVGISFYTFQTLSYTIDVYRKKISPTHDPVAFAAFVAFFPQLVAGPIERATHLLPQFFSHRRFSYPRAVDGLRQILWGLTKKIVIADNCASIVNHIFDNSGSMSGSTLLLGAAFFAFQIYGDFSGYSDIAIGSSRLFGFDLNQNFAYPYFSRNIGEFWRRWHISLSTWFRDYLYIPLGGSRGNTALQVRNVFIIFLVSGFWHGANWTFIVWGFLNAVYFLPSLLRGENRRYLDTVAQNGTWPGLMDLAAIGFTFLLTTFAWIFFRADNMQQATAIVLEIFSLSLFTVPSVLPGRVGLLVILFMVLEWIGRKDRHPLENIGERLSWSRPVRWSFYYALLLLIALAGGSQQEFIYFQF